ncbi:MAG: M15 family metallopeptidase [Leptospiraceae bacterium]|nr:M15 family metallopeptidase [Leptospiraceae bacterium]MCK6382566.1 M15 family metallopeptidase [Leptospiraceae bacterium]NUM42131.1 M15 family metallopeptidase [Leptospiraceae bacterium]
METNNTLLKILKTEIAFVFLLFSSSISANPIYLGIEPAKYLIGDFSPEKYFEAYEGQKDKKVIYLRKDVILALNKMLRDFDKERENKSKQNIFLVSGFRSFSHQKNIWEGKYRGDIKMSTSIKGKTPEEKIFLILQYSSAPGTSRHHWGTDFDINVLRNDYYEKNGHGEYLYNWLKKNAAKYGFCQPYNEYYKRNNAGYLEEKWHWSYAPIANQLLKDWVHYNSNSFLKYSGRFLASEYLKELPYEYVVSVNKECNEIKTNHFY